MKAKEYLALRPVLRTIGVRISDGPNKGKKWSIATRSAFRRGYFERSRVEVICALAKGAASFWDAGAHIGYITLAASSRIAPGGRVISIECNRDNLWYLRRHISWNRLSNVTVLPVALGSAPGQARFNPRSSGTGLVERTGFSGGYYVDIETVDSIVCRGGYPPPQVFKVDIDHVNVDFLAGACETLQAHPMVLILATNNSQLYHARATRTLESWGYRVHSPARCTSEGDFKGIESELLAVGPGCTVNDSIITAFLKS